VSYPSEREHYRIQYPMAARPKIVVDGRTYDVVDISERGVRFKVTEEMTFNVGDGFSGQVRFKRSDAVRVGGKVVRIVGKEIAAKLDAGIPLKTMIEEQRYIREQHRGLA